MAERFSASDLGIPPSVVKTWDATLVRETRVLVPVHLDVLLVRQAAGEWADCRLRTPAEAGSTLSTDLLPTPFHDLDAPRAVGAYLHWAAPDALATLVPAGSTLSSPALPDRWLVVRIAPGPSGKRAVQAWVLDSRTAAAPVALDAWTATAPTGPPVTVLGIGDAGWAAYYDNVVNRFAFYDPLKDVPAGPIAYLVCGWYADPSLDPLAAQQTSKVALAQYVDSLGWSLAGADATSSSVVVRDRIEKATTAGLETPHAVLDTSGNVTFSKQAPPLAVSGKPLDGVYTSAESGTPRSSLFHGAAVNLSWPRADQQSPEVGGPPDGNNVQVSIGVTPIETLAALIAKATSTTEAEWLTAFAVGALDELRHPNGTAKLDDHLHDAAFVSRSDGNETIPREPSAMPPRPANPLTKQTKSGWTRPKLGGYATIHEATPLGEPTPEPTEVTVPKPRLFMPSDPVIAIQGAVRSFKHGGDGRFGAGKLECRLSGATVHAIACRAGGTPALVRGSDVLDRPLAHGGIPPECEDLLEELGVLDPGSAPIIANVASRMVPSAKIDLLTRTAETEQTVWWSLRNPATDARAVLANSAIQGTLPSPIAIRPPQKPWVPLHLDWEIEYVSASIHDWSPGETDLIAPPVPDRPGEIFSGRSLLSPGVATAVAASLKKYLDNESAAGTTTVLDADASNALQDAATRLQSLDVLAGPLERFHATLRRKIGVDDPSTPAPPNFVAVRSGFLKLRRLRLVDAFGQTLDLAGSSSETSVDLSRVTATGQPASVPGVLTLPPRFTAPTKVQFRFRDAARPTLDATDASPPVSGWLMPNHIDGGLEFFDGTGSALGELWLDPDAGTLWEPAPGTPAAIGARPSASITDTTLASIAEALLDMAPVDAAAKRPPALAEMLRVVDATRWAIDPFAHVGEEHLSLLVGHPVAVVLASLKIEVREPATGTDVPITTVPVRLGSLIHWEDGLFGFFVDGDFRTLHCATAAAALARPPMPDGFLGPIASVPAYSAAFSSDVSGTPATPVTHPYVDSSGVLWVAPNIEIDLVLLLEPHTLVHATTFVVPRKDLGVRRAWMAPALAKMAPTFRYGPVLHDPTRIRMPVATDLKGAWSWTHRSDVDKWTEDAVIPADQSALLPPDPVVATEGWLRLTPEPQKS